jgi:predicted Rossmann fold nucleotide-binding protein DprA/Smf involved in DNA uptake
VRSLAFTGPVEITEVEAYAVRCALERVEPADVYISGAAFGVDTAAALAAVDLHPEAEHRVYVPAAWHNEVAVEQLRRLGAVVFEVDPAETTAASYMVRNDLMVAACTELIGFPYTLVEELRSGTWATIRRARRARRAVRLFPLREGA